MERIERFYRIDHLLRDRKVVTFKDFLEDLEVSPATVKRDLEYMRDRLYAPIDWDSGARGYRLGMERKDGPRYELPGLWFNASEVFALLTMQHLLVRIEPGLLGPQVKPLNDRLKALLERGDHSLNEIERRIRILHMGSRRAHLKHFALAARAVLKRRRIHIKYLVRSRGEETDRDVSPQRLVHYRDNWYLDGWCHLRKDIRSFSVDAIQRATLLNVRAKNVRESELDAVLGSGYGIFSGKDVTWATLRFAPEPARRVSIESWHPKQRGRLEKDGTYVLELPYSDDRELVMDILKYGPDVEVLHPAGLRTRVQDLLLRAARNYS